MVKKQMFYAVANGHNTGIFLNWSQCSEQVKGFPNAKFQKFHTEEEAKSYITKYQLITDKIVTNEIEPDYYIYTDGACSNNGKENALAGIGIYFGEIDKRNISQRVNGKQTNNVAELQAIISAYEIVEKDVLLGKKIVIISDSEYAIGCINEYGETYSKNNYKKDKKDIPNKELVQKAYELFKDKNNITCKWIRAHTNKLDKHYFGNEQADKLANQAIGLEECPYNITTANELENHITLDSKTEFTEIISEIKIINKNIKKIHNLLKKLELE